MHKLVFKIPPVPASRPRVTQYGAYYNAVYDQFRKNMAKLLTGKLTLYAEPLRLDVTFFKEIPKSYSKKRRDEMDGTYISVTPDLDNLEKAIYDSLNDCVWKDDCQIVEHTTRKVWVKSEPSIVLIIERLHENTRYIPK
jgi:Holliday junction resolvase RusA-like endonuclease